MLIALDKHQSHMILPTNKKGMVMPLPPHTSLKVQHLEGSVYGPCKTFVKGASEARSRSNPGKTMTIYDIPFTVSQSMPNAFTAKNVK